jgi:hypothetical protein
MLVGILVSPSGFLLSLVFIYCSVELMLFWVYPLYM